MILGIFIGVFFMYAVLVFGSKIEEDECEDNKNE